MKFTKAVSLNQEWSLIKRIGTNTFIVDNRFQWWLDYDNKKDRVIVETWFETDFGSIPRLLWIFFNPTRYIAYILHDKLYSDKYITQEDWTKRYITREEADQILFRALLVEWCSETEARFVYIGVRIGWWLRWKKQ